MKEPADEAGSVGQIPDPAGDASSIGPIVDRVYRGHCWVRTPNGPRRVAEPLDDGKVQLHLKGKRAYGACPIAPGASTTRLAVLDLDSHDGTTPFNEMQSTAGAISGVLDLAGIKALPFRSSGGRGIHLYMLWGEPQDAYSVRKTLTEVLDSCGLKNGSGGVAKGQVEIFPKQDSVPVDGFGSMVILPFAGKSEPLSDLAWRTSEPVPVAPKPERLKATTPPAELKTLAAALKAIPNTGDNPLDYDTWRNCIFAIHHATDGSDDGLALAHEFSQRNSKYDADFLDDRVWPYVRSDRDDAITARTIFAVARTFGWSEPVEDDFEVIKPEAGSMAARAKALKRNGKGDILATIENVVQAVGNPAYCGVQIRCDQFRDEIMLSPEGREEWRALTDADYVELRIRLERSGFKPVAKDTIRDAVLKAASDRTFDSAILWLSSLPWDGRPRVARFLAEYFNADATPYVQAVSMYLWSALAGRVLSPGVKADMVPVLVGPQGIGKSSAVAALVPSPDHFVEVALEARDEDQSRKIRGRLVGEIAELRGLRSREHESIKAFITRTHEVWTPKWREFSTTFARRLVFVGTTNSEEFLDDETGNRRWLPVKVGQIDVEGIARDRLQLWAEAREIFRKSGIAYQDAERLAVIEHEEYALEDSWQTRISQWLEEPDGMAPTGESPGAGLFTITGILTSALGLTPSQMNKSAEMRAAKILTKLGYQRNTRWREGEARKMWSK